MTKKDMGPEWNRWWPRQQEFNTHVDRARYGDPPPDHQPTSYPHRGLLFEILSPDFEPLLPHEQAARLIVGDTTLVRDRSF